MPQMQSFTARQIPVAYYVSSQALCSPRKFFIAISMSFGDGLQENKNEQKRSGLYHGQVVLLRRIGGFRNVHAR